MQPKYLKVIDNENLIRDTHSKAILNIDKNAFEAHKEKKKLFRQLLDKNKEVDELKQEVKEIKDLLSAIANKLDNR